MKILPFFASGALGAKYWIDYDRARVFTTAQPSNNPCEKVEYFLGSEVIFYING